MKSINMIKANSNSHYQLYIKQVHQKHRLLYILWLLNWDCIQHVLFDMNLHILNSIISSNSKVHKFCLGVDIQNILHVYHMPIFLQSFWIHRRCMYWCHVSLCSPFKPKAYQYLKIK